MAPAIHKSSYTLHTYSTYIIYFYIIYFLIIKSVSLFARMRSQRAGLKLVLMSFHALISINATVDISHEGSFSSHNCIHDDYVVYAFRLLFRIIFKLKLNLFILVRLAPKYLILTNKSRRSLSLRQADFFNYSRVETV